MQIQFTARHFDATPSLRSYVEQRIQKLTRFYDGITDVNVVLRKDGNGVPEKSAEISLRVFRQTLTAQATSGSHEEAIDNCVERLRRQLMKYKAKLKSTDRYAHR